MSVEAIKELQKTDPEGKQQWIEYCTLHGEGNRDPARHDIKFIKKFLAGYEKGNRLEVTVTDTPSQNRGSAPEEMVEFIRVGQRNSQAWKQAWQQYVKMNGGGKNDPAQHDAQFIVGFMDTVGSSMLGSGGGMSPMAMSPLMDMMSSMMGGGMPKPMASMMAKMGGASAGNSRKDELVTMIKQFQREDDSQKQQWWAFAAAQGGGNDPARHDVSVLNKFVKTHMGGQTGAKRQFPIAGGPLAKRAKTAAGGGKKDALVVRIKAFQREDPSQKEQWWEHCDNELGGVRDPAKHDVAVLEDFVNSYGVP